MRWVRRAIPFCALGALVGGCELEEVTLAESEAIVVAEVSLRVEEGEGDAHALLHRSVGHEEEPVPGARVFLRPGGGPARGSEIELEEAASNHCLARVPSRDFAGTCLRLPAEERGTIRPATEYEVRVELPGGGRLEGWTRIPGDFVIHEPWTASQGVCRLAPETGFPVVWSRARGAWAYLPEASLEGLRDAYRDRGVEVPTDPTVLTGIAVSEADTTIAFPEEFGVFNRFGEDRELVLELARGVPEGVRGRIVVTAMDRNATNWARGGGFNPTGWTRIPSLEGEGTGVVRSVVVRGFEFLVERGSAHPSCLP